MSEGGCMTPEQAQQWLDELVDDLGGIRYIRDEMRVPLETIAGMSPEYRSDIVDPFTNGGRYEVRTMVRHVTQWEETT